MTQLVRAALYLRISLDQTGEGLGVKRQREACTRIAHERGWKIVREYSDSSISASDKTTRRPQYDQMSRDYEAGLFDALICWDLDRLTRQPRQLEDWIDAAEGRGLRLVTANGEADLTTDGGRMYARIKAAVARSEVERKSARQVAANRQRALMGKPPIGKRLTGYTKSGAVVPEEAETVKRIFDHFLECQQLRAVARSLNDDGIKTRRGGDWYFSSVRTILTNPRYAGRAIYRGEETGERGDWEPLVTEETFDMVQAILRDPDRKTKNVDPQLRKHLGSGLFYCTCGRKVRSSSAGKGPTKARRYRCAGDCFSRSMDPIDELVLTTVRAILARPELAKTVARRSLPDVGPLMAEIDGARARIRTIESDYDQGLIDGRRYKIATDKASEQVDRLTRELASLQMSTAMGDVVAAADPVEMFDSLALEGQRAVIDTLVKVTIRPAIQGRKTFDPDSVQIEWRFTEGADDE